MKRGWLIVGVLLAVASFAAAAQVEGPLGYVRDDLQLISQQSLPEWSARWTGPIQAATILAWFADNGYPRFLRDYNGDGVIDELDTIQLADNLGRMLMKTETMRGTTDARLVLGLAQFVADTYPDEFVLKIYDAGFGAELAAEGAGPFSETMVPGILLSLEGEPNLGAYESELLEAEGVIVGLDDVADNNAYLSGRSFLYEETTDGYTPVDLAWSEEDRWEDGFQGQVLETLAMQSDAFYIDYRGAWTLVEFLLALSPLREPSPGGPVSPCPEDAIAYDVTETTTTFGRVRIEECVTRETIDGVVLDTYEYIVTNIDFVYNGCGICLFFIPDVGVTTTVDMDGPNLWMMHAGWAGWWWGAPLGSCGILPGTTAVFSFTVIGPTFDTWLTGAVGACAPAPVPGVAVSKVPLLPVRTTGPGEGTPDDGEPDGDCPDLVVRILGANCVYIGREFQVTVAARVLNIGTATADANFVQMTSSMGGDTEFILALAPGASDDVEFTISFTANQLPPCPLEFTVEADAFNSVTECNEDNNEAEGSVYCPNCK
ncbi:MAG: CARDB domain-containing protein [Candidatus Bipolaricaulota bacterium]